jgi:hypothetical protein
VSSKSGTSCSPGTSSLHRSRPGLSAGSQMIGVSPASVYFWETDHCRPRDYNLTALCRVLRLPIRATREMAE